MSDASPRWYAPQQIAGFLGAGGVAFTDPIPVSGPKDLALSFCTTARAEVQIQASTDGGKEWHTVSTVTAHAGRIDGTKARTPADANRLRVAIASTGERCHYELNARVATATDDRGTPLR